jgi:putative ABC transport system ATP-binding protein
VFQSFNLLPRYSATRNVELPMLYGGVPRTERRARAEAALHRVGLGDRMHHQPNELSGGQQQRVSIARALVQNPVMLLADEPTGALDSETTLQIMDLFCELHRAGMTIVLVTHEPAVAEYAQRVLRVRDGRIVADERKVTAVPQAG